MITRSASRGIAGSPDRRIADHDTGASSDQILARARTADVSIPEPERMHRARRRAARDPQFGRRRRLRPQTPGWITEADDNAV